MHAHAIFAPFVRSTSSSYPHISQTSYPTSNNDAFGEIMSNLENQKAPPAPTAAASGGAGAAAAAPGSHLKSAPLFELMEKVRGYLGLK